MGTARVGPSRHHIAPACSLDPDLRPDSESSDREWDMWCNRQQRRCSRIDKPSATVAWCWQLTAIRQHTQRRRRDDRCLEFISPTDAIFRVSVLGLVTLTSRKMLPFQSLVV